MIKALAELMHQVYNTNSQQGLLLLIMLFELNLLVVLTGSLFLLMQCLLAIELGILVSTQAPRRALDETNVR